MCNAVYIHRNDCRIEIMISSTWLMILWDLFRFSKNFSDLKESFCAICLMVCIRIRNLTLRKWFLVEISLIKSMNMKWFQHLPDYSEKQNDKIGIIASWVLGAFQGNQRTAIGMLKYTECVMHTIIIIIIAIIVKKKCLSNMQTVPKEFCFLQS